MQMNRSAAAVMNVGGRWSRFVAFGLAILFAAHAIAQAPAAPGGAAAPPAAEELDALVGRIALYPDDLVSIILPASTSPLQLVQADRYLDKRKADPKLPIDDKWDDAVKSLLNYPDVVKMMSGDLDWTSALGEAVVTDQGAVLDAIQSFRRRAQAAGNLKSDGKQVVAAQQEVITIVPADPQVIYVPQYNPTTVVTYGVPYWGYYPTAYPSYYYPYAPGAALAAGVIWGAAIGAAWNGGRYATQYGGNANINVNRNTNINTGNINTGNVNRGAGASQLPAGGSTAWKSNKQPGQVSSSVGKTANSARVGDTRAGGAGAAGGGGGACVGPACRRRRGACVVAARWWWCWRAHPRSRPAVARWVPVRDRSAHRRATTTAAAVGAAAPAATPSAATARAGKPRWTALAAHRAAVLVAQRGGAALAERRWRFARRWRWWWTWRRRSAVIAGDAHAPNPFNSTQGTRHESHPPLDTSFPPDTGAHRGGSARSRPRRRRKPSRRRKPRPTR